MQNASERRAVLPERDVAVPVLRCVDDETSAQPIAPARTM
jgi:hypothetical protein